MNGNPDWNVMDDHIKGMEGVSQTVLKEFQSLEMNQIKLWILHRSNDSIYMMTSKCNFVICIKNQRNREV